MKKNILFKIIIVIAIALALSCKNKTPENQSSLNKVILAKKDLADEMVRIDSIDFDSIHIISIKKTFMKTSKPDTVSCKKWYLNKDNIKQLMKKSRPISIEEWHYQYDVLSCVIEGELEYKKQRFKYGINAGARFDIKLNDTIIRYGCNEADCKNYFLSMPWNPSKE